MQEVAIATITFYGKFKPGPDPRRHVFTREECMRGYHAAIASLERRYPGCDPHFLMCAIMGSRPWYRLPQIRALMSRSKPLDDAEIWRLFARDEEGYTR
jgi:hypothetical protein